MRNALLTIFVLLLFAGVAFSSVSIGSASYICGLGHGSGGHIDLQNHGTSAERFFGSGKIFLCPGKTTPGCNQEYRGMPGYREYDFSFDVTVPAGSYDSNGKFNPGRADVFVGRGELCDTGGGWQIDIFNLNGRQCPLENPCWGSAGYIEPPGGGEPGTTVPTTIPTTSPQPSCSVRLDSFTRYSGEPLEFSISSADTSGYVDVEVRKKVGGNEEIFSTVRVGSVRENGRNVWIFSGGKEVLLGDYVVRVKKNGIYCNVENGGRHVGCAPIEKPTYTASCSVQHSGYAELSVEGWPERAKKLKIARKPANDEWSRDYRWYRIVGKSELENEDGRYVYREHIGGEAYDYNVQFCTDSACMCKSDFAGQRRVSCESTPTTPPATTPTTAPSTLECSGDETIMPEPSGRRIEVYSSKSWDDYGSGIFLRIKKNGQYVSGYITPDNQYDDVVRNGRHVYVFTAQPLPSLEPGTYVAEFHLTSSYMQPHDVTCASRQFSVPSRCGRVMIVKPDCQGSEKTIVAVSDTPYTSPSIKIYSGNSVVSSSEMSGIECPSQYTSWARYCYSASFTLQPGQYRAVVSENGMECATEEFFVCRQDLCGSSSISISPLPWGRRTGAEITFTVASSISHRSPRLVVDGPESKELSPIREYGKGDGCLLDYCYEYRTRFSKPGSYTASFYSSSSLCSIQRFSILPPITTTAPTTTPTTSPTTTPTTIYTTTPTTSPTTTPTTTPSVCRECCTSSLRGYVRDIVGGEIQNALVRCSSSSNDYTATSGADGYYSIQGMECGVYACSVSAKGYNPAYSDILVGSRPKIKVFYLYHKSGDTGDLDGYVLYNGKAVSGAKVSCGDYVAFSSDSGYFQLEGMREGRYVCTAGKSGYSSVTRGIEIKAGKRKTVYFRLPGGSRDERKTIVYDPLFVPVSYVSIKGRVDYEGKPLEDAYVRCGEKGTYTDAAGRFSLSGLRSGKTLCIVEKPGYGRVVKEIVAAEGEEYFFRLSRQEECINVAELSPDFSSFEGREKEWRIDVIDQSFASCGNVIKYSVEVSKQGPCTAEADESEVYVERGNKAQFSLTAKALENGRCLIHVGIRAGGKLRAEGMYILETPMESEMKGPGEAVEGEEFEIEVESPGSDMIAIYLDNMLVSRCEQDKCTYKGRAVAGEHSYYAEIYRGERVDATPVKTFVVYPSREVVVGRVLFEGRPAAGAVVSCGNERAVADEFGYFSAKAESGSCMVEYNGISAVVDTSELHEIRLSSSPSVSGGRVVEARSVRKDGTFWQMQWIRFGVLVFILSMLIILAIAYIIKRNSVKEEEELLRELERHRNK